MDKPVSLGDVVVTVTADTSTTVKKLRAISKHLAALADELDEIEREGVAEEFVEGIDRAVSAHIKANSIKLG